MDVKKCIEQSSETGIAEVFVKRRHGAWFDFAPEPVAHHHVVAFAQFFHESRHVAEVVAVVRIPHNDERAAGAGDARAQRSAVAPLRHANHPRSVLFRDSNRIVRRAVVRDDYFPGYPRSLERLHGFVHAIRQRVRFIQARNNYGHLDGRRHAASDRLRPFRS